MQHSATTIDYSLMRLKSTDASVPPRISFYEQAETSTDHPTSRSDAVAVAAFTAASSRDRLHCRVVSGQLNVSHGNRKEVSKW